MSIREIICLAVAFARTAAAFGDEAGDEWGRDYYVSFDVSPVFFSLGKATSKHWNYYCEADVVQRLSDFGYALVGWWAQSDIDTPKSDMHRAWIYESDPYVFYGYRWHWTEGWFLDQRFGMIWVTSPGYHGEYRGVEDHSFREWTYIARLGNPYVTPTFEIRRVDRLGTYLRLEFSHEFAFDCGVSLTPYLTAYGGNGSWNASRFGNLREDRRIGDGLVALRYGVRLAYALGAGVSLTADVSGYDVLDSDALSQISARRSAGNAQRNDQLIVTTGLAWNW